MIKYPVKYPVTTLLLCLNAYVFYKLFITYGFDKMTSYSAIYNAGGVRGDVFYARGELIRLVTPVFIHIGLNHFVVNSLSLIATASVTEKIYGRLKTLILYLLTAISGNVFALVFTPTVLVAGASTAIFGFITILATLAVTSNNNRLKHLGSAYVVLLIINLVITLTTPGVSLAGHLGGIFGGLLLAFVFKTQVTQSLKPSYRLGLFILYVIVLVLLIIIGKMTYTGYLGP